MNASFNLQEVTIHHVEKNGTIIIILLDSTKAFDTVPHDGLRVKLFDYGAAGKLWLLLDNMYNNLVVRSYVTEYYQSGLNIIVVCDKEAHCQRNCILYSLMI